MKAKLVNIIGPLVGLVVFGLLFSSLVKSLTRLKYGDSLVKKNEAKLEEIQRENKKLQEKLETVQSSEYLEKQFRDKLGLVKEGEIVIVLPEAGILKPLSPELPNNEKVKPKANWEKWIDLFE